ncbi:amidophosphoribosyltransferase [Geobacter sp. SVR]|nr:amidophosphoribosyltransferase [Geobacter sp. SVR]GCF85328.1 amidophosphoribosyltransferase [Geobacter sp. SVR]
MPPVCHPCCSICGIPFHGFGDDHPCSDCLTHAPGFDAARSALLYEGGGRELIHAFKYHYRTHLRRPLALLAVEQLSEFVALQTPDLIVPVPLHVRRLRSRGFNQAVLLAEPLAREWGLPLKRRLMRRVRWTRPQIELDAGERRANVRGAFAVDNPSQVTGKRILLVDDVFTTGSTVDECARVLKKAGACHVTVITMARAVV